MEPTSPFDQAEHLLLDAAEEPTQKQEKRASWWFSSNDSGQENGETSCFKGGLSVDYRDVESVGLVPKEVTAPGFHHSTSNKTLGLEWENSDAPTNTHDSSLLHDTAEHATKQMDIDILKEQQQHPLRLVQAAGPPPQTMFQNMQTIASVPVQQKEQTWEPLAVLEHEHTQCPLPTEYIAFSSNPPYDRYDRVPFYQTPLISPHNLAAGVALVFFIMLVVVVASDIINGVNDDSSSNDANTLWHHIINIMFSWSN